MLIESRTNKSSLDILNELVQCFDNSKDVSSKLKCFSPKKEKEKESEEKKPPFTFGANADSSAVSEHSKKVLKDVLDSAGEGNAIVTSTTRDPYNQARVMYGNIEREGFDAQKELYGASGDKVIDVYQASKDAGKTRDEIIKDMEDKINEVGPEHVSKHCADTDKLNVIDIAPSSIKDKKKFIEAVEAAQKDGSISKFLKPPGDPAYHIEISQPEVKI